MSDAHPFHAEYSLSSWSSQPFKSCWNNFRRKAPFDRSSSQDTAVACCCRRDGADAAATELMLRAARTPPRGAAASLLEVLPAARAQLRRSSVASTQLVVFVASLLEVLPAAPTRRHLEGGRELRAASAPSQKHQLRRSSRSRTWGGAKFSFALKKYLSQC